MPPKRKKKKPSSAAKRPVPTADTNDKPAGDRYFMLSAADQKNADREIDRRTAAVALAVRGFLPVNDIVLLVAGYEDQWIPNAFRQVETWYRRLNNRLSYTSLAVEIAAYKHQLSDDDQGYKTVEYALDGNIIDIRPTVDSVVFIVQMPKYGVFDFEPTLAESKEIVFRPTTSPSFDGFDDVSFWISNAQQCVYTSARHQTPACPTCLAGHEH